jgi:hypothetical protein
VNAAGSPSGRFGIRLMEAPVSRRDDPRAQVYIVDHLPPGAVIHRRIEISNSSPRELRPWLYSGAAAVGGDRFTFAPGNTPNELSRWISVDRPSFAIPPHTRTQVRATVKVPRQASSGERYAVIWAQVASPKDAKHNVSLVHRVGIRVYLDVGPGGEPASDFEVQGMIPGRAADGRPQLQAMVRNTGHRALDLNGTLTLSDGPGSLRAGPFLATPGTTLAPGEGGPVMVTLDRRLPAGPWKADLHLYSGRVKRSANAVITFPAAGVGREVKARSSVGRLAVVGLAALAVPASVGLLVFVRRRKSRLNVG